MSSAQVRILVVCGSGVATSTVVSEKVKEISSGRGWNVTTSLCRATDVRQTVGTFQPDVVLATTAVPADLGVPTIRAMGLLTGIGEDEVIEQVETVLEALHNR